MKERTKKNNNWLKLDNAALIYPSSSSENWNSVFRLSAYLKAEVNPEILQQAVNVVIERFPNFDVTLRRGMFWYYLQGMNTFPKAEQEVNYPCRRMEINRKKHLFRVLYYKNKISFESFHCLTDGYGAMCFLNSLLACYFSLVGEKISTEQLLADYNDKCSPEEMEDSFKTFTDDSGCSKRSTKKAYQIHGTPQQNGVLDVVTAVLDLEKTKQVAKEKGCTITQLLTAVYAKSIINYQKHMLVRKKPVIISLPVNLRKIFDTKTLRNFSSWVDVAFEGKDKNEDLDVLIKQTKEQMLVMTKENMTKNINANIKAERNFFVRIMPLFLKNIALKFSYKAFGEYSYTTVISNMGSAGAPKEFDNLIERYDCMLGKSLVNSINIGVISHNNNLSVSFTSAIKEKVIEKNFCRLISTLGIGVTVFTNVK